MNSIRIQVMREFENAIETFGFRTKENRYLLGLSKEHYFDAVAIATKGKSVKFKTDDIILKRCVSDGDYQLYKGVRSEKKIEVGKIQGFRKFDKVKHKGKKYFIKGRMSSGYLKLMDIDNQLINLSPIPKFSNTKRISARKSWLIDLKKLNLHDEKK